MVRVNDISRYILIFLLVCFLMIPARAEAEGYTEIDISTGSIVIGSDGNYRITGNSNGNNITVRSGVNAVIQLDNVRITSSNSPVFIENDSTGNVTIELIGRNELYCQNGPGICKNGDADNIGRLTICGNGSLISQNNGGDGAGIGSSYKVNTRNIYITDGNITATAGLYGAGIGGGGGGGCASDIYISGGKVTATGGSVQGAGIGGGSDVSGSRGDAKNIFITGGTVNATAPGRGAGIGGGNGEGTDIYITGGTVAAKGSSSDNCIGGNKSSQGPLVVTVPVKNTDGSPATYNVTSDTLVYQDNTYTVSGNITLPFDLNIKEDETFSISEGATFTNNAVITNNGEIVNNGDIINNGTIENNQTLVNDVKISGNGTLNLNEGSTYIIGDTVTEITSGTAALNTDGTVNRGDAAIKETVKDDNGNVIKTVITDGDGTSETTEYNSDGGVVVTKKDPDGKVIEKITIYKDGSYVKDGFTPKMVKGNKSEYDGKSALTFCSDDELINFIQVNLDGKKLDAKYYDVAGKDIKVTLKKEFLDTLSVGTHRIEIVSTNGKAEGIFTVLADKGDNFQNAETSNQTTQSKSVSNSAQTGDSMKALPYLILLIASAFVGGVAVFTGRRKER